MSEITDAEIGAYDQGLAEADAEIDRLLSILQIAIREVGEHQAMASVFLLVSQRDRDTLTGLLMTALRRLAGNGDAGDERA